MNDFENEDPYLAADGNDDYDPALDDPKAAEEAAGDRPPGPAFPAASGDPTRISIDWVELEGALENNSPELHSFLNKATGDVVRIFRGSEGAEQRLREVENDDDYLYIEPISSREQYRWMEEFIEATEEPNLKDKLNIAIDGKGAFRRFKDVLVGYPEERERWFAKRSVKLRTHITEWLTAKNMEALNVPPWEEDAAFPPAEARGEQNREWVREGATDLRQVAHDIVDLIPSRELPTAVAFLEFLRSRRGFRRPRYGG
jgi:hypothetical protein